MPSEHEEHDRQVQALQRYVSDLYERRERGEAEAAQPAPTPEPESWRPSRRWLLLTGVLVILALVGGVFVGAVAWSDDQPAGAKAGVASATRSPGTTTAAPLASPECKTAVDRANAMLAIAVKLQETLAEQDRILTDPANGKLSGREVLKRSAPSLRAGSSESDRFNQALAEYRQVVDRCELRTP
jgi:hypothetical protein